MYRPKQYRGGAFKSISRVKGALPPKGADALESFERQRALTAKCETV